MVVVVVVDAAAAAVVVVAVFENGPKTVENELRYGTNVRTTFVVATPSRMRQLFLLPCWWLWCLRTKSV